MEKPQSHTESTPINPEILDPLVELQRLQHGVTVLNFFDQEVEAEDRLNRFVRDTRYGSETRDQILHGQSYRGDEKRLNRAINRAEKKYIISDIKRRAILEQAGYEGVPAKLKSRAVEFENDEDQERVLSAHARWRVLFASRQRTEIRAMQRAEFQSRIDAIKNANEDVDAQLRFSTTSQEELEPAQTVDVHDRAFLVYRAVQLLAHVSKIAGLGVAVRSEYRKTPIWEYYGDKTAYLTQKAENRAERLMVQVGKDFAESSGYAEAKTAGLMTAREYKERFQHDWRKFLATFEQSPNQGRRLKIRKTLGKYLTEQEVQTIKSEVSGKSHS
jgi:hypothetical protein